MANLTIAVDEQVLRRARLRAAQQGTSVNALLRDYLASFADDDARVALAEFHDPAHHIHTRSEGCWSRGELYDEATATFGS